MALLPMSLRLEALDGSGGEEYRIHDGEIEVRKLHQPHEEMRHGVAWHRLTPGQLSSHVHENTVVAQWLERRIGWRGLLLACADQEIPNDAAARENAVDRYAA